MRHFAAGPSSSDGLGTLLHEPLQIKDGEDHPTAPMPDIKTLLLTDLVDSTRLAEAIGDAAMAALWTAHDRLARDLLDRFGGREIDKTDGLLLLFDAPAQAAGYALAYHAALRGLPQPVLARAGIHYAPVLLRENSAADVARGAKPLEVEGLAKPITARVMSLARGGQTLLTADARRGLGQAPLLVQSHGHWLVKGVAEPQELFEVGEHGAAFVAPDDSAKVWRVVKSGDRWVPARQALNNLPTQLSAFFGRDRELDEIKQRLAGTRLLTLQGMGGLGKTRLAVQAATELMPEYPDGVWFLDFAPIRDAALVLPEAAEALGVREVPGQPLVRTLTAHLAGQRALLILDNCEHLVAACAELAIAVLRAAPGVQILAASRELLRVPGEQACPVAPLPLPAPGADLGTLAGSTAVRLFVERAQAHRPGFALTEREAPAVAELVTRLEGIPLALELAAARVRALSVADLNTRLKDRFRLLTGGARGLQARQQTLRALVDWSYELLREDERSVLDRLSVFMGGFDLAAAEAVCGAEPLDPADLLDLLEALIEKSLLLTEDADDGLRYRMLETIREYAREKLDAGDDAAATAARHADHYFGIAKATGRGLRGPEQAIWVRRGEAEHDNLRAAMALALAGGVDPLIAVKMAVALQGFWILRGHVAEGRAAVQAALARPEVQAHDTARAHALYVDAALAGAQSNHAEACRLLADCLALRRSLGEPLYMAATLSTLALSELRRGEAEAAEGHETEALALFRSIGNQYGEVIGLTHLGQIALHRGDDAAAAGLLDQALALARTLGQQEAEAECTLWLGELAAEAGRADEADRWLKRSLQVCRDAGDRRGEACTLLALGRWAQRAGDAVQARRRLSEALPACARQEMREELLDGLEAAASLLQDEGRADDAQALAAAVARERARLDLPRAPRAQARWQAAWPGLADGLPAGAQAVDQVIDLAAALRLALAEAEAPANASATAPA